MIDENINLLFFMVNLAVEFIKLIVTYKFFREIRRIEEVGRLPKIDQQVL